MVDGSAQTVTRKKSQGEVIMKRAKQKARAKANAKAREAEAVASLHPPPTPPTLENQISLGMGVTTVGTPMAQRDQMNPMHQNAVRAAQDKTNVTNPLTESSTSIIRKTASGRNVDI